MRAVIYARYSSDQQSAASIEDQVRLCRERLAREGWALEQTYVDRAMSGASLMRPGIQALLSGAMAMSFDVVVAEALDRISRDQEDVAGFYKRMNFAGIRIVTLAEGEISDLHVGLKGTMNALFLKDLADKTRRGLRGRVEGGKSGGGNSYGYDVVHALNADGSVARGDRRINIEQATNVHRIFEAYASGRSPRRIAAELNRDGIPCPSGATWGSSTINGNAARGTGILNNELYVGRLIWNRLRYSKNPDTGKRVSRLNAPDKWVVKDVPHLRIIDDELWQRVKDRQQHCARNTRPDAKGESRFWKVHRPKTLFSGLMHCGSCDGSFVKISANLFGCAAARNKGTCSNRTNIRRDLLEAKILSGLTSHLLAPELFKVFADEFYAELNRQTSTAEATLLAAKRELAQIERKLSKLVSAIADGGPAKTLMAEVNKLEARQSNLEREMQDSDSPPSRPLVHPALASVYEARVRDLAESLNNPALREEAATIIRSLVDAIVLSPRDGHLDIELRGELASILAICSGAKRSKAPADFSVGAKQIKMVAGAGFEPATFRL